MIDAHRSSSICLLPALAVLAVVAWWIIDEGGYEPIDWLAGGLLTLAVAAALVVAVGSGLARPSRPLAIALAAFAGYVAWSYLSILWADDAGAALLGSHRTLVFFCAFAAVAILPWTRERAAVALAAFSLVVAAIAGGVLVHVTASGEPLRHVLEGRLDAPLGYPNAVAAMWTMAALPAIVLASRAETAAWLRPPLLAAATLLLEVAVLTQSRGWLLSLPVVALIALLATPQRLRLALWTLPVLLASGLALPTLIEPYEHGGDAAAMTAALDSAARAVAISILGALAAGTGLVLLDRRLRPDPRTVGTASRVAAVGAATAVLAGGLVAVASIDGPADRVASAWEEFTGERPAGASDRTRFTTLQSPRYRTWRVAVDAWLEAPLAGLGQDNFAERYLLTRRTDEEPRWPHSLELRLLVHTGAVGALLFAAFLAAALVAVVRAGRGSPGTRAIVAAATLPLGVWVVHGSVDWLWEVPALSVSALALLAMAARLDASDGPRRRPLLPSPAAVVAVPVAFVAAVALVVSFLAERDLRSARDWQADPAGVLERLDRAQRLAPLDHRPALTEGLIAWRAGDRARARQALLEAADRKPRGWFIQLELGLLAGELRDLRRARAHLRAALKRNPDDEVVQLALRRAREGRPLPRERAEALLNARWEARVAPDP